MNANPPPAPLPASSKPPRVLLLPGWLNSDAAHWQSRWERLHRYRRVEQADWLWPRRGDWMARLDEVLLESTPAAPQPPDANDATDAYGPAAVLVAHSLGCLLVAAWAAHSQHVARVHAALLVAPPDTERADTPPNLFNWRPIERRRLPFAAHVVSSDDDPFCSAERAARLAADWGCEHTAIGALGHINAASGLGDWPDGHAMLTQLAPGLAPRL
ncbi:MAG: alpha/beta hydrolase [Methylibium sp. NZG]|nr:MAG: alpha/beta hydrolase [Methylibium sp. NZG]